MPAEEAGIDPGQHGEDLSEEEVQPDVSVAQMAEEDVEKPGTPSRRSPDGGYAEGSFDLPLEDFSREPNDGG
jgi:hypothetical protein